MCMCMCIKLLYVGLIKALSFLSMTGGTFNLDKALYKTQISCCYRLSVFNLELGERS
jgi:hypothetical protein